MTFKTGAIAAGVAVGFMSVACLSQAGTAQPSQHEMTTAVNQFLADHGDLCVGKFTWPRVVTAQDREAKTNDAVQLPVLERLGLVVAREVSAPASAKPASWTPAAGDTGASAAAPGSEPGTATATAESGKSYSLTEKGRKYYLQKRRITVGAHDRPTAHDADLCVGHLSLDKVVKWSNPEQVHGHLETVVRYTYHIKAADWMEDPQARQVFPVIDRIIRHEDNMLMSVTVRLENGKWRPVLPTL